MMDNKLTNKQRMALFTGMLYIRVVEEELVEFYAEQQMRCPVHFCIGQEAISEGVAQALSPRDTVMSNHRSHGHYLAKGGDLRRMVLELYGKAGGCAGGKGGSMHLIDLSANFLGATSIVAETIPVATGVAFATKYKGGDSISTVFFGDAATEEGLFYESLNFAALKELPMLYICENNYFSVYTPLNQRQPRQRKIHQVAKALGLTTARINGNYVEAVYAAAVKAVGHIRSGKGPYLIEAETYRHLEHCGPNCDISLGYRKKQELEAWKRKDPVRNYGKALVAEGVMPESYIVNKTAEFTELVHEVVAEAKAAPWPSPKELLRGVYAT